MPVASSNHIHLDLCTDPLPPSNHHKTPTQLLSLLFHTILGSARERTLLSPGSLIMWVINFFIPCGQPSPLSLPASTLPLPGSLISCFDLLASSAAYWLTCFWASFLLVDKLAIWSVLFCAAFAEFHCTSVVDSSQLKSEILIGI